MIMETFLVWFPSESQSEHLLARPPTQMFSENISLGS